VGARAISHYCLSNAPAHVPWPELVRVQAQRYFIEHSFREAKSECALCSSHALNVPNGATFRSVLASRETVSDVALRSLST
jgi:hypothetical protein